jgi:hypothetical protein
LTRQQIAEYCAGVIAIVPSAGDGQMKRRAPAALAEQAHAAAVVPQNIDQKAR